MMQTGFYTIEELAQIGFASIAGYDNILDADEADIQVQISRKASIYSPEKMSIGNHVRIDDFCILSGAISIGNYVHISAYSALFGSDVGIILEDFSGISVRSAIFSRSDDYSGEHLTNSTIPKEFLGLECGKVILRKHVLVGAGTIILPGVEIGIGTSVGSMSFVNESLDEWGIYAGVPCKRKKDRSKNLLKQEELLMKQNGY